MKFKRRVPKPNSKTMQTEQFWKRWQTEYLTPFAEQNRICGGFQRIHFSYEPCSDKSIIGSNLHCADMFVSTGNDLRYDSQLPETCRGSPLLRLKTSPSRMICVVEPNIQICSRSDATKMVREHFQNCSIMRQHRFTLVTLIL